MAMKKMMKYDKAGVKVAPGMREGGESMAGTVMNTTDETMSGECSGANPGPGCRKRGKRQRRKYNQTKRRARRGKGRRY